MLFLQHLRNDLRRCSNGDEEGDAEVGWKHIRGDVFRYPPCISLFCAILGGGTQFFTIATALELHNLYASIWGYKIYTLPIILFVTFIILIITVGILSVGFTCIQLSVEDYEWWWRSVLRGGSVAIFMFLYLVYFYAKSSMRSFLQPAFFLGYNVCMCYAFFLMLRAVSFSVSLTFIRYIYHAVK
ncbi:Nonaspanin (TM9SF) [Dillenia turbinata]|uniref:Transmembrane 9 superfamily member n=1 Tax=Dillenia turbinata TaxID=194707 RepID=A0AAN8VLG2_9MAGN